MQLIDQFLGEEGKLYVRGLLLEAVRERGRRPELQIKKINFNRFEVTLDFETNAAVVTDILDPEPSGEVRLPLDEFLQALT